jgi:phage terminase Nu1 subunit (DNA packaging protein)
LELTRKETAAALGVDPTTLDSWTVKGCPASHPGKGRPASFDLQKVIAWRIEHEVERALTRGNPGDDDREAWQTRKLAAQARLAEIEVETRKGRLVDADEITDAFTVLVIGGREHVRNVAPGRIARRAVGETSEGAIAAVAKDEIEAALTQWSLGEILDLVEAHGGAPVMAAGGPCPVCGGVIQ